VEVQLKRQHHEYIHLQLAILYREVEFRENGSSRNIARAQNFL